MSGPIRVLLHDERTGEAERTPKTLEEGEVQVEVDGVDETGGRTMMPARDDSSHGVLPLEGRKCTTSSASS